MPFVMMTMVLMMMTMVMMTIAIQALAYDDDDRDDDTWVAIRYEYRRPKYRDASMHRCIVTTLATMCSFTCCRLGFLNDAGHYRADGCKLYKWQRF